MGKRVLAGVDVSARFFTVVYEIRGGRTRLLELPHTAPGHRRLARLLTRGGRSARVCLEASGVYHLDLSLALHQAPRVSVMVANPRATRDFARAQMQRSKTDATDAASLLEFVRRMPFAAWKPPASELFALRAISRRITAMTTMASQERNRRHVIEFCQQMPETIADELAFHLEFLKDSAERLAAEALQIIDTSPSLRNAYQHLVSVRGIAQTSAVAILGELAVLPSDMSVREWVAHAGLDPRRYESGSSIDRPTRISRHGNRYLRAALYMPALVAIRHEPQVRVFYERLLGRGKKPMQAIVAVMRKLLHSIYGMLHLDQDFDGAKFCALAA